MQVKERIRIGSAALNTTYCSVYRHARVQARCVITRMPPSTDRHDAREVAQHLCDDDPHRGRRRQPVGAQSLSALEKFYIWRSRTRFRTLDFVPGSPGTPSSLSPETGSELPHVEVVQFLRRSPVLDVGASAGRRAGGGQRVPVKRQGAQLDGSCVDRPIDARSRTMEGG
ncbi:MAG: hypothetical protein ACJATT_002787 [Myxococcota bacterium]|jgi:hypothetical protein